MLLQSNQKLPTLNRGLSTNGNEPNRTAAASDKLEKIVHNLLLRQKKSRLLQEDQECSINDKAEDLEKRLEMARREVTRMESPLLELQDTISGLEEDLRAKQEVKKNKTAKYSKHTEQVAPVDMAIARKEADIKSVKDNILSQEKQARNVTYCKGLLMQGPGCIYRFFSNKFKS